MQAEVQQIHEQLVKLTPPSSRQPVHALVLDATRDCSAAMEAYRAALATNNANDDAPRGQALVRQCVAKLERLREKDLRL
jgi:hypothetical protein